VASLSARRAPRRKATFYRARLARLHLAPVFGIMTRPGPPAADLEGATMKGVSIRFVLALASLLVLVPAAQAQLFRAYVSAAGSDSNPCTLALPCRLLPAALNAVATGGEIWMLDSANFNNTGVSVTKNVTILAIPGQVGSIVAFNGAAAIYVSNNAVLKLRNVAIGNNVTSPGTNGIEMTSGTMVSIEDSVIDIPTGYSAAYLQGGGSFSASSTVFRGGGMISGSAIAASNNAQVDVANSRFYDWARGVYSNNGDSGTTTYVGMTGCAFSHVAVGLQAMGTGGNVRATVTGSSFIHGQYGIVVYSSAGSSIASVGGNTFTDLTNAALFNEGGIGNAVLETMGTNVVRNNASPSSGTITGASQM